MVIEIVIIPRHLLEKYTTMFTDEFEKEDRADPTRHCSIIDLSISQKF
jgi:hypothetical protein